MDREKILEVIIDPVFSYDDYSERAERTMIARVGLENKINLAPILASGAGFALVIATLFESFSNQSLVALLVPSAWMLLLSLVCSFLNLVCITMSSSSLERWCRAKAGNQETFKEIRSKVNYSDPNLSKIELKTLDASYQKQIDIILVNENLAAEHEGKHKQFDAAAIKFFWVSAMLFFASVVFPLFLVSLKQEFWFQ